MGIKFRKSKNFGPVRVNISKSGIGYSVGNKYARATHTADGKKRTTYTIPGTGVSWVETDNQKKQQPEQNAQRNNQSESKVSIMAWIGFIAVVGYICWLAFFK